ncbi:MAG: 3-hydroxybutyryl-CoA dehydrogenase [Hyphomicrobiaceae bacterium]
MINRPVIACIGAGRMGRGIAHAVAYAGHQVRLLDAKPRTRQEFDGFRQATLGEVEATLRSLARLGAYDEAMVPRILERVSIHALSQADTALCDATLVFEGVPEVLEMKQAAFALFDRHAGADAILASTTSTILSTDLAKFTETPERFLNAHWLNPAFLVPLVEVSPCQQTAARVTAKVCRFLEGIGKVPVVCKASPGYIVPRIQALAMNEAARLVEDGVASPEDVDKAIKYGFGLRFAVLGMLEFIDWGGGDILYYASRYMSDAMQSERFAAPDIIEANMENDRIGLRTGLGFYDYSNLDVNNYKQQKLAAFLKILSDNELMRPPIVD